VSSDKRADKTPVIALVVAIAENGAIGRGGELPWRLLSDMRYFRKITMGKPVIMGRRTFKSLPRSCSPETKASSRLTPSWPIALRRGSLQRAPLQSERAPTKLW
jgi:dihydrofolate reductase